MKKTNKTKQSKKLLVSTSVVRPLDTTDLRQAVGARACDVPSCRDGLSSGL